MDGQEEISITEQLKSYLGQLVGFIVPGGNLFGILHSNPEFTMFGIPPNGFPVESIVEVRKIEVPPEKNLTRAVIVLK